MKTSANRHAQGALKLVDLHLDHPGVISQATLRGACLEALGHLQAALPHSDDLGHLYSELLRVTPRGTLPYVNLTGDAAVPYSAIITDSSDNVLTRQRAKSIDGLVQIIAARFEQGRGGRTA